MLPLSIKGPDEVKLTQPEIRGWTVKDSAELYHIRSWGAGYFNINEKGNVEVAPAGEAGACIDLHEVVQDLQKRGYRLPFLLRFSDILKQRVQTLFTSFEETIKEYGYKGRYRGVYPIKVNQQRHVVEELINYGDPHGVGLEAGSKPELLVALALLQNPESLIICNGYKDSEYIETAMLAQKVGRNTIIVIDRYQEVELIIAACKKLNIKPRIGMRARLSTKGAGKWVESTGDRSKFGLTATEMVEVTERLRQVDMLDCLQLLHFHIGSQITAIRAIKEALREACRIYVELVKLGAPLQLLDVGGGLGVDYDGSQTNFHSSTNYSLKEYANDVVAAIQEACDLEELPHPDIVSESGRAMVAHHSVLIFNVLGVNEISSPDKSPEIISEDEPEVVHKLYEVWSGVSRKNFIESYHDALAVKEEATSLFNLGYLDLKGRARIERLFWSICDKLLKIIDDLEYVPEELEGLQRRLSDTYYCNFSVFQSAPDHWAVKQLFPTLPLHRHKEKPTRRGILADMTCDSDGKVDQFIDLRDVKETLELHPFNNEPYYMGMFLLGAYQEILGDLHNLFGDTTAIHMSLDVDHGYRIEAVVEGDSVTEVLSYVQYDRQELVGKLRVAAENAVRTGALTLEESALFRKRFEDGLAGYTYLYDAP
jgi:arginine decarboxylase